MLEGRTVVHAPARHRNVRTAGRHRAVDDRHWGLSPAFRIDAGSTTTASGGLGTATYARYVGRIGALAVALGVGAALATCTGAGMARADDGADSSSSSTGANSDASSSSADSPATSSPTEGPDGTTQLTTGHSGSNAGTSAPDPTAPDMNFDSSGGAHTSTNGSSTTAVPIADDDTGAGDGEPVADVDTPTITSPGDDAPGTAATITRTNTSGGQNDSPSQPTPTATTPRVAHPSEDASEAADHQPAVTVQQPDATPLSAPAVATSLASAPEAIEPETTEVPAEEPSVVATMLTAAIAPFLLPSPNSPAASPLLWAVMAWTRRAAEQTAESTSAARATEVPTDALAAADQQFVTDEDVALTGTLPNLPLLGLLGEIQIDNQPVNGTVTVTLLGDFEYTPNPNFHGVDGFSYVGMSLLGIPLAAASVTITVLPVNDAPVAADYNLYTPHDTPLTVRVLDDAADGDGDALTSVVLKPPVSGTVVSNSDGSFTYAPDAGFVGEDLFTYAVTDASGLSATGVVWITVRPNQAPIAPQENVYSMTRDGTLVIDAKNGVLVDDYDPDGDEITLVSFETPSHGTLTWASDGSFTYVAERDFIGFDRLTYTIRDAFGGSSVGHVLVVIDAPPNQPPRVVDHVLVTEEGIDVGLDPIAGLEDPDGDPLVARVGEQPLHGFAQQTTDGTIFYVPDRGFVGTDSYTYTVFDGYQTVEAKVTITVGPSTRPIAVDDEVSVREGGNVTIDVLKNDVSPRGDVLKVELVGGPSYGKVEYNEKTRTFVYTAGIGNNMASDSFSYEVTDKDGRTSMATVDINIKLADTGPQARDDWASTPVNTAVVVDVLANDITPGEKPPLVRIDTQPRAGKAVVLKDGTISYTPEKDFTGTVELGYSVTDSQGGVSRATVTITVYDGGQNANDKWYTVAKDRTLTVSVADGVLSGPEQEGWSAGLEVKPRNGTLAFNEDGSFTYTPDKGFVGQDTFAFYVHTSEWGDGPFTVTIDVTEATTEPNPEANYGTAIALESSSAFGTCGDNLMPGQGAPADVWPTCLFTTAVRRPSDPW